MAIGCILAEPRLKRSHGDPFRDPNCVVCDYLLLGSDQLILGRDQLLLGSDQLLFGSDQLLLGRDHQNLVRPVSAWW